MPWKPVSGGVAAVVAMCCAVVVEIPVWHPCEVDQLVLSFMLYRGRDRMFFVRRVCGNAVHL